MCRSISFSMFLFTFPCIFHLLSCCSLFSLCFFLFSVSLPVSLFSPSSLSPVFVSSQAIRGISDNSKTVAVAPKLLMTIIVGLETTTNFSIHKVFDISKNKKNICWKSNIQHIEEILPFSFALFHSIFSLSPSDFTFKSITLFCTS